jgi:hypothetical protein
MVIKKYKKNCLLCIAISFMMSSFLKKPANDPISYSFVVVGCNRLDKADTATSQNPSTANVVQLRQTFNDVAALQPVPSHFFFLGDLVMGYTKDTSKLGSELRAWKKVYESSSLPAKGTRLVVTPGNHESLISKKSQKATWELEDCWVRNMKPYIAGSNGPKKGGLDSLQTDQSRLNYSFDYKTSHFIVLNTDPAGREARVPVSWIKEDMAKAGKGKNIFALSHKPAYSAPDEKGLDEHLESRDALWNIFEAGGCKAMLSAHNHLYYRSQPKGKTWQIIAGNGGSPLAKDVIAEQSFYGFTVINVYKSGKVEAVSYGRPLPTGAYNSPIGDAKTTIRDKFILSN